MIRLWSGSGIILECVDRKNQKGRLTICWYALVGQALNNLLSVSSRFSPTSSHSTSININPLIYCNHLYKPLIYIYISIVYLCNQLLFALFPYINPIFYWILWSACLNVLAHASPLAQEAVSHAVPSVAMVPRPERSHTFHGGNLWKTYQILGYFWVHSYQLVN